MDITSSPNLKPFRDYSEHDVIGLYAHASGNVNKGTWVSISAANGKSNVQQNTAGAAAYLGYTNALSSNTPSRATILRPEVTWKVDTATNGDVVLGIMLYDVKEFNSWGEKYIYQPSYDRAEQQVVVSGEAVPVLTDGLVLLNGFVGTPAAGSGAIVGSGATAGKLVVSVYSNSADNVGKFLTSADADGYAIFKVEC